MGPTRSESLPLSLSIPPFPGGTSQSTYTAYRTLIKSDLLSILMHALPSPLYFYILLTLNMMFLPVKYFTGVEERNSVTCQLWDLLLSRAGTETADPLPVPKTGPRPVPGKQVRSVSLPRGRSRPGTLSTLPRPLEPCSACPVHGAYPWHLAAARNVPRL